MADEYPSGPLTFQDEIILWRNLTISYQTVSKLEANSSSADNVAEFQAILSTDVIDMKRLRTLCFNGVPDGAGMRSLCWKRHIPPKVFIQHIGLKSLLLLGYLPPDRNSWPVHLKKQRETYKHFVHEVIIEQYRGCKDSERHVVDHPLNPNPDSQWMTYFKDNEVLLQVDKDCRRLYPDISFFQTATPFPNKDVIGDDKEFETLRKRVERSHLEASSIGTNRQGITNLVTRRKLTDEYQVVMEKGQEAHWEVVERALFVYAKLNPGIAYVQGMNEIMGPLYYIFATDPNLEFQEHAEADSFFCFTHVMSEIRDNFIKSLDDSAFGIGGMMTNLMNLLRDRDLVLWKAMEEQEMKPQFYSFRWLTLLLSQEFPLPDVIRVWDSLFSDSNRFEFLTYVCCAMLVVVRDQLLIGDFATSMKLLQNYPDIDIHTVLSKAMDLKQPAATFVMPSPPRTQKQRTGFGMLKKR